MSPSVREIYSGWITLDLVEDRLEYSLEDLREAYPSLELEEILGLKYMLEIDLLAKGMSPYKVLEIALEVDGASWELEIDREEAGNYSIKRAKEGLREALRNLREYRNPFPEELSSIVEDIATYCSIKELDVLVDFFSSNLDNLEYIRDNRVRKDLVEVR
jgi:hypothetical protein